MAGPAPDEPREAPGIPELDLMDLRRRLDELRRRAERLGSRGTWTAERGGAPPEPPPGATEYAYGAPGGAPQGSPEADAAMEVPRYEARRGDADPSVPRADPGGA